MGIINATGCTSVWGSTYPFNPYPFPWANHLFQDTTLDGDGRLRRPHGENGRAASAADPGWPSSSYRRRIRRGASTTISSSTVQRGSSSADDEWLNSARRSWRSVATARCMTSASKTSRALMMSRANRSRSWSSTPRSTRTPAARRARPGSSARSRTWRSSARPSTARRRSRKEVGLISHGPPHDLRASRAPLAHPNRT